MLSFVFDGTLLSIFLASTFFFWYRVSQRIPELVVLPEEVISAHLQQESAKFRLILLHFRTFLKGRHYRTFFANIWGKFLYRCHIALLKLDNVLIRALQRIRERGVFINGNDYWKQLRSDASDAPEAEKETTILP